MVAGFWKNAHVLYGFMEEGRLYVACTCACQLSPALPFVAMPLFASAFLRRVHPLNALLRTRLLLGILPLTLSMLEL